MVSGKMGGRLFGQRGLDAGIPVLAMVLFAAALVTVMNRLRPLPFGSTGDAPVYFLPLIKAQTDAWLSGHFPAVDWRLGCGWTPWEGVQAGVFYPPYLLANLLARLMGRPLALLEVSAGIHLALAGLGVYALTAGRLDRQGRLLWAGLAVAQPAPIAIGMNWHNYLAFYPWYLGLLLLLWRVARGYSAWTRGNRMFLLALVGLFFLSAHPQMFVIGSALLFGWRLALGSHRAALRDFLALAAALSAVAIPLLFVYFLSRSASPVFLSTRGVPSIILRNAQSISAWLVGLCFGNLIRTNLFRCWLGVSWTGIGMFFSPLLILSVALAIRKRNWIWCLLVAALALLLGARSFQWLTHFSLGPLFGFRWTWKLSIFAGALALAMALAQTETWRPGWRFHRWALAGVLILSVVVSIRALRFDTFDASRPERGVDTLCAETRALMQEWGIRPGERIAWVGRRRNTGAELAAPLHGLLGNAPLLVGLHSAHLYEPLEDNAAARAHDYLSVQWYSAVPWMAYAADPGRYDRRFGDLGVTWLVSPYVGAFAPSTRRTYLDSSGNAVYGKRLPPLREGLTFPWGTDENGRAVGLIVEPGGALRTTASLAAPPRVGVGRPLNWRRLASGHWRGTANVVDAYWFGAGMVGLALSILWLGHSRRWGAAGSG